MLFEIIDLSKFIIHGGQHKSIQQIAVQEQQYVFNPSVYELFGIIICVLFNHLMTSLNVICVLYSFCVFIVFSCGLCLTLYRIPFTVVLFAFYTHNVPKWE